eukprot:572614-Prorocentrum_minimum.AAC.2
MTADCLSRPFAVRPRTTEVLSNGPHLRHGGLHGGECVQRLLAVRLSVRPPPPLRLPRRLLQPRLHQWERIEGPRGYDVVEGLRGLIEIGETHRWIQSSSSFLQTMVYFTCYFSARLGRPELLESRCERSAECVT